MIAKLIMIYHDGSNLMSSLRDCLGTYPMPDGRVPETALAARDAVLASSPHGIIFLVIEDDEVKP